MQAVARTHEPLLSIRCTHCGSLFAAVARTARFCSEPCKNTHWRAMKRRDALALALMNWFDIADCERLRLMVVIDAHPVAFEAFADWLGLNYIARRYVWEHRG